MSQNNANTLGGLSLSVIAQESLPVLQKAVPLISLFTTDFSNEVAQMGTAVVTRYPTATTAGLYTRANGYATTDATASAVTVTLSQPAYVNIGFTDYEVSTMTLQRLQNTFVNPAIYGVINHIQSSSFGLVQYGAHGSASYTGSGFTFDNMATSVKKLWTNGVTTDKAVVLNADYYWKLASDVKANYLLGSTDVIRGGIIGNLAGATVAMAPAFATVESQTVGFACGKEAIAIATRLPLATQANMIQVENVTDPKSGLTLQLRTWYSPDKGLYNIMADVIYGVQYGQTAALTRITDGTGW